MRQQTLNPAKLRSQANQRGSFLVAALVMIVVLTGIGIALASLASAQYSHTVREEFAQNALLVAEAGIEQTVHQVNADDDFAGYTTPVTYFNNTQQGKATFQTTVSDNPDDNSKTILSTGTVYRQKDGTDPYLTHKIKVTIVGTTSGGYSVSTGPGGLILGGSASITNSNVYVNGHITMTGASSIGSSSNPVNIDVANIACPSGSNPGSTYPTLCTDGTQPISLAWSTNIYGTTCATGQTDQGPNHNFRTDGGGQGLKLGCVAPPVGQPHYDRQAVINEITTTTSGSDNTYNCSKWVSGHGSSGFTVTWPANIQFNGNVSASSSCDLTITGDVYITGNLTIGGAAKIRVADSVGKTRPKVFVDGTINVAGSGGLIANSQGTGMDFVSFKNSTGNPAATPTGTDLYNSQKQQTVTVGGAASSPGMVFDAYWGKIKITGSGNVGAAAGQTVDLSGAGTVIFGTELSSGSKTWAITSYQRVY